MDTDAEPIRPEPSSQASFWRRNRLAVALGAVAGLAVLAFLAFGVFGVQTLFIDEKVDEAGPVFDSGAEVEPSAATTTTAPVSGETAPETTAAPTTEPAPVVTTASTGTFTGVDHPGRGTVNLLTDGTQTFVRFEDDFSTDNGPDLFAVAYVGGDRIELGTLKGNQGSQNYELPADIDPAAVDTVAVWCKRFDSTFTEAAMVRTSP